jgi:hypothetical protein
LKTAQTIKPSEEERKNGWDEATLAQHIEQTQASAHAQLMNRLFPEKPPLRVENVQSFDPHKW